MTSPFSSGIDSTFPSLNRNDTEEMLVFAVGAI